MSHSMIAFTTARLEKIGKSVFACLFSCLCSALIVRGVWVGIDRCTSSGVFGNFRLLCLCSGFCFGGCFALLGFAGVMGVGNGGDMSAFEFLSIESCTIGEGGVGLDGIFTRDSWSGISG